MSGPLTRGFLFADLRGYTAYVDRRGASAAAALLDRFRGVVRTTVTAYRGAEIRTEGDSFYVVFASASMAVACALDIVRAAADESGHDDPIHVGIGVHAGEALETPDGPVGTAVNIAARLCAMARPGEVLVSDTVRSLTRSVGQAGFIALGRRPIKGVDEPLLVFRAVPAGTTMSRRRPRPTAVVATVGTALLAVIAVAALSLTRAFPPEPSLSVARATQSPSPEPSRSRSPLPTVGSFRTERFAVPFTIELGRGWGLVGDRPDVVAYKYGQSGQTPVGWLDLVLVAAVLDPPCMDTPPRFIEGGADNLIEWVATRTWLDADSPRPYNVGPYLGRAVDIEIVDAPTCGETNVASMFRLGSPEAADFGYGWGADIGERKRVIAVDVADRTVTIAMGSPYADVEGFWELTGPLLQTIRFVEE